ncbi:uncharacterized protein LOC107275206 isoform X3 [Cephus cinctus]|uniref:Uncharacterized protein LOC107275206 isoform X3 n=1 Tax=Cephus cinctus TaxID=211228 RepID=A0AAJ7CGY6_CEPCN|nr:uncharacterized protein LOC107275206 isoform X3 [Cephus cinctus]
MKLQFSVVSNKLMGRFMNIVMKECVYTDPRGDNFKYDMFFVQARNIRYVHIPADIPIMPAIKKQLQQHKGLPRDDKSVKPTFKTKRAQNRHHEGMMAVQHIMKSRNQKKSEDEDEDSAVN